MTQPEEPPSPEGVPTAYIMQLFEVKLVYNGKSWMTPPLEVSLDVLPTADEAVEWANALVAKIDAAE